MHLGKFLAIFHNVVGQNINLTKGLYIFATLILFNINIRV